MPCWRSWYARSLFTIAFSFFHFRPTHSLIAYPSLLYLLLPTRYAHPAVQNSVGVMLCYLIVERGNGHLLRKMVSCGVDAGTQRLASGPSPMQ